MAIYMLPAGHLCCIASCESKLALWWLLFLCKKNTANICSEQTSLLVQREEMQVWRSWSPTISALCSVGIQCDTEAWVLYCIYDSPAWILYSRLRWMSLGLDYTKRKTLSFLLNHLIHLTSRFCCFTTELIIYSKHFLQKQQQQQNNQNYLLKTYLQNFEFTSLVYRTGGLYSSIYTAHIFRLLLFFQRPIANCNYCLY